GPRCRARSAPRARPTPPGSGRRPPGGGAALRRNRPARPRSTPPPALANIAAARVREDCVSARVAPRVGARVPRWHCGGMETHAHVTGGNGVRLHVVETGNPAGRPILFVHGFSQSWL